MILVTLNVISYNKATEINFQTTLVNVHRREVFEFGLLKRDLFMNMNLIIALTRAFSLAPQFSICE